MYNGEVKIRQANIQSFLAVAEKFRVRGLCQNESNSNNGHSGRGSPDNVKDRASSPGDGGGPGNKGSSQRGSKRKQDLSPRSDPAESHRTSSGHHSHHSHHHSHPKVPRESE